MVLEDIFAFVALHKGYVLRKHKCGKTDTPDSFSGSAFPVQGHRTGAWMTRLFMALVSCSLWGLKGTYLYTRNNNQEDVDSSAIL